MSIKTSMSDTPSMSEPTFMSEPTSMSDTTLPFIFGAQYYRAPTPESACWETDLGRMRDLGFNHIKFWAQWRWSHRSENEFYFDDLDRLMDLAHKNGLAVTINTIFESDHRKANLPVDEPEDESGD